MCVAILEDLQSVAHAGQPPPSPSEMESFPVGLVQTLLLQVCYQLHTWF